MGAPGAEAWRGAVPQARNHAIFAAIPYKFVMKSVWKRVVFRRAGTNHPCPGRPARSPPRPGAEPAAPGKDRPMPIARRSHRIATLASLAVLAGALIAPPAFAADAGRTAGAWGYVLLSPGSRDVSMSGSTDDVRRARSLRSDGEGLLYVHQGGSAYVIRDAATLRRAQALFEAQKAMGARQSELGARQAALGHQQARLGAQQARLGLQQASSSSRDAEALSRQ